MILNNPNNHNKITMTFVYKGGTMTLPVNPKSIGISRASNPYTADIIGLGEVSIPIYPKLARFTIESFFWAQLEYERVGMLPQQRAQWFIKWQASKEPARFTVEELEYNFYVLCSSFDYDVNAGEESDVYYKLDLVEYRPHGAERLKLALYTPVQTTDETVQMIEQPSQSRVDSKPQVSQTYLTKEGDSIWSIASNLAKGTSMSDTDAYNALYTIPENRAILAVPGSVPIGKTIIVPREFL